MSLQSALSPQEQTHAYDETGLLVTRRPQVGVRPEGLRVLVAQAGRHDRDRFAAVDEGGGVGVTQVVEGRTGRQTRHPDSGDPAAVEARSGDDLTHRVREEELERPWLVLLHVCGECVEDEVRVGTVRRLLVVLGGPRWYGVPGTLMSWWRTWSCRFRKSTSAARRPSASPCRRPVPAASSTSARYRTGTTSATVRTCSIDSGTIGHCLTSRRATRRHGLAVRSSSSTADARTARTSLKTFSVVFGAKRLSRRHRLADWARRAGRPQQHLTCDPQGRSRRRLSPGPHRPSPP